MALSQEARRRLILALVSEEYGKEVADMIEAGGNPQADNVAELGATTNLVGVDGVGNNAAPLVGTEARLDAIEAKIDEVIAALVASGLMAS